MFESNIILFWCEVFCWTYSNMKMFMNSIGLVLEHENISDVFSLLFCSKVTNSNLVWSFRNVKELSWCCGKTSMPDPCRIQTCEYLIWNVNTCLTLQHRADSFRNVNTCCGISILVRESVPHAGSRASIFQYQFEYLYKLTNSSPGGQFPKCNPFHCNCNTVQERSPC